MKTILKSLDYSSDWTSTGTFRDGREVFRKEITHSISAGNNAISFSGNYARYNVGCESYLDRNDDHYLWCWQFFDGTNRFGGYVDYNSKVIHVVCNATGTAYLTIYGW